MTVNGKQKGSQFEREICVKLSKWLTKGEKIDCLWRSAMSGGRATVQKGKVRQAGDITAVAPEGHVLTDLYYLELKHYKKLSIDCLLKGKGPLIDIWNVAVREAAKYQKIPALIYKQNSWPVMFVTTELGVEALKAELLVIIAANNMNFIKFEELLKKDCPL